MKGNKNPVSCICVISWYARVPYVCDTQVVDMSSMNDNVLRPWARNPETDIKVKPSLGVHVCADPADD